MSVVGVKINLYFTYKWFYGTEMRNCRLNTNSNKNDATFYYYKRKKKNKKKRIRNKIIQLLIIWL